GIEQIVEPYVLRPDAGLERVALAPGAAPMHAEELAGVFESRIPGEHGLEPGDPVAALAGFSVGKPRDAAAERRAQHFEHLPRACQRHAADDVHAARQSSLLFRLPPYLILSRTRKARACRRMCGKYGGRPPISGRRYGATEAGRRREEGRGASGTGRDGEALVLLRPGRHLSKPPRSGEPPK